MRNNWKILALLAGAAFFASTAYSGESLDMLIEANETPDPKKKKAGEECKASSECQRHHTCDKRGQKKVCTAPERFEMPNT